MNADDIRDFNTYLKQCTNAQVRGVFEHESTRGGDGDKYAELARTEAERRGIALEE